MTKTEPKTCEVCGTGCAPLLLSVTTGPDRAMRLAAKAIAATSAKETLRWLDLAERAGAPESVLEILSRAEPLAETGCCQRVFHVGCEPEGVGECLSCHAWICNDCTPAGQGCSCCGSGRTASGKAERVPPTPEEIAIFARRITGRPEAPPEPDRRLEAIRKMQGDLAHAASALIEEEKKGEEVTSG